MSTKDIPLPPARDVPDATMETDRPANQPAGTGPSDSRLVTPAVAVLPLVDLPQSGAQRAVNVAVRPLPTCPEIGSFSPPRGTVAVNDNHTCTDTCNITGLSPIASDSPTYIVSESCGSDSTSTHMSKAVNDPYNSKGLDTSGLKPVNENIMTNVDKPFSLDCIFALIDDKLANDLSKNTSDSPDLVNKLSQDTCSPLYLRSQTVRTDSGYDSALFPNTDGTRLTPSSDIFFLIDSSQMEQEISLLNQTNQKIPDNDMARLSEKTDNTPVSSAHSLPTAKPSPHPINSPFTCAQRACNNITFMYMSPGKLTNLPTSSTSKPHQTTHPLVTPPENSQVSQKRSDTNLDTTLEVLESLDTGVYTSPLRLFNSNPVECVTHQMDKQSTPKRVIKKAISNTLRKIPPVLGKHTYVTTEEFKPCTPNKRNTKCKLNVTELSLDLETPKSKLNKTKDTLSKPITQSTLDFVIESTSNIHSLNSLRTTPGDNVPLPEQLKVEDFITQVTAGNFHGNTCQRTPDPNGWMYPKVTRKPTHTSHKFTPLLRPQQGMSKGEDLPYFLRDKNRDDRDDWFTGRREMACSTRQTLRRSYIRQSYQHNLLTEWATSNEGMPPWLQNEDLNTKIFEVKARTGREI